MLVHPFATAALLAGSASTVFGSMSKSSKSSAYDNSYMVPGPPSYIFGTYTMCAYYNTQFRCTITIEGEGEGVKECSTEQRNGVSVPGSPYTRPGNAFATISSPPSANGTATADNVPGLEMRRFIPPYVLPTQTINSETGYIGQLEANPFQTRDPQIKVRFEQVYHGLSKPNWYWL